MNIKVLCIDEGHTVSGADYGAKGNGLYESVETRELGALVKKYLEQLGVKVDKCTIDYANSVSDSINKRLAIANSKFYDLVLIIHFNSFPDASANGCEVFILPNKNGYYRSSESYNTNLKYAQEILDTVCTVGDFYKRSGGVKFRDDLGMLLHTNSYAVYLEVCFLTNKKDADNYKANKDKIARALAEIISNKKLAVSKSTFPLPLKMASDAMTYDGEVKIFNKGDLLTADAENQWAYAIELGGKRCWVEKSNVELLGPTDERYKRFRLKVIEYPCRVWEKEIKPFYKDELITAQWEMSGYYALDIDGVRAYIRKNSTMDR